MTAPLASGVRTALVVGGGIYGLCTAWALARRGVAVTLVEAAALPNPRGSSYDEHRIIRHAYGKLEGYARMMPAAFDAWEALWGDLGVRHYAPIGATYFLRTDDGWRESTVRALDAMGIGYRETPLDDVAARFPMIRLDGLDSVLETDGAGMLFPVRILTDLVVHLARIGVDFITGEAVTAVDPEAGAVTVGGRNHCADMVLLCAGPWIDRLAPGFRGKAVPSRQAVLYLAPPVELAQAWSAAPVIVTRGTEGGLYVMPPRYGARLKVGDHRFSRTGDPDGSRTPTGEDIERVRALFETSFREPGQYRLLEPKACFYTVTEDESFLVEPMGARGFAVSACSGHGFKLAPLIADRLAETVAGRMTPAKLAIYAAGRSEIGA
jgi:glycine/D-amino acid oxidase-like deaminating enzyme